MFGTIPLAKIDRSASSGAHGNFRWITTVSGDGASTDLIAESRKAQPFVALRFWSIENFTSAEVIGLPSENLTPCLSLKV